MCVELNHDIIIVEANRKVHTKASEEYLHVKFIYPNKIWDGWVPVVYRRTGVSIDADEIDLLNDYLNKVYEQMNPKNFQLWLVEQERFWKEEKPKANTTKSFFDCLVSGGWQCVECQLPKNPNWARRIQDLKEFGYTLATDTNRYCPTCKANKTHIILLPIERYGVKGNGYETWSPKLRKRIIDVLGGIDVYDGTGSVTFLLPDHKFPEIRWDENTKSENPDTMSDDEIKSKFQLLTNQRNQQKREVCRNCFQTGQRGIVMNIPFFYKGGLCWDESIPKTGKDAEKGCVGCAWYDIVEWRKCLTDVCESYDPNTD